MISSSMLATFVSVAETLNVSRSATELGVGKSVTSKRVAQLEGVLGVTLFSRSTRHIALTAAGEVYLEHARRALTEMTAGEERLRALRADLSGQVRVTAPVSWGQRVLSRLLPEFLRLHPSMEVELVLADRVMDVAVERMDLALRWSAAQTQQDLAEYQVACIDWYLVAAPGLINSSGQPNSPDELRRYPLLCYRREAADDLWTLYQGDQTCQVQVNGRYRVDNPEVVLEACLQGLGVALLPDYLCRPGLADGRLLRVLPAWTPKTRFGNRITALIAPDRLRLTRNRRLIEFLQQQLLTETPHSCAGFV
jgi:DNA-binding transcriptional LysR family regulator